MNVVCDTAVFSTQENDNGETREERKENGTSCHVKRKFLKLGTADLPPSLLGGPAG